MLPIFFVVMYPKPQTPQPWAALTMLFFFPALDLAINDIIFGVVFVASNDQKV